MSLDAGIVAFQVRTARSGSYEPYVRGLLQGLGELQPRQATLHVYLQDPEFDVPAAFRSLSRASVHIWRPGRPQREARLINEISLPFRRRHDVLFYTGSSVAPASPTPQVAIVHADPRLQPGSYGRAQSLVAGAMLRLMRRGAARVVIAPSEAYARHLSRAWGISRAQLVPVPHGVDDLDALASPINLGPGRHVVAVTNDKAHKNLGTLLAAWDQLAGEVSGLHLWLVGNVQRASVTSALGRLPEPLHLTGWMPHFEVMRHIGAADVLVFPSELETFGMPLAEAMAAGTPVIAADTAVAREVCASAATFVPPQTPQALANALARVLGDAAYAGELRSRGLARAKAFTWRETASRTLEVLEGAARQKS